jgi:hypothetical protein
MMWMLGKLYESWMSDSDINGEVGQVRQRKSKSNVTKKVVRKGRNNGWKIFHTRPQECPRWLHIVSKKRSSLETFSVLWEQTRVRIIGWMTATNWTATHHANKWIYWACFLLLFSCRLRSSSLLKDCPHPSLVQTYGFSPEWELSWPKHMTRCVR